MHGIGMRWQAWDPVLALLAPQRDVIAIDLPGFGSSPMPPSGTQPGIESLTRLVAEFLEDELALDRPHVAGNSLGGWVALELAKRGHARSATGISPAGFHSELERRYQRASLWTTKRLTTMISPFADRVVRPRVARALIGGQYFANPTQVPVEAMIANVRAAAQAPWFDETMRAITDAHFTGAQQIAVPVTIAWGEHDRLLLPRQARRAKALIPSARMITLTGCGHVPMWDDPQQVAGVLLEGSRT
jgi:pimeloyl-ACP methyl ester carboxylesterase